MFRALRTFWLVSVVFSLQGHLWVSGTLAQQSTAVTLPKIEPPKVSNGKQDIPLPAVVDDIDVGGGGRYLALHFKALQKIGIFDVNQLKIIGYVPAGDGNTRYAAGATKLIVVSGNSGVVARWDIAAQKQELVQPIDLQGAAGHAILGSASAGPAIISGTSGRRQNVALSLDVETLRATPFHSTTARRGFEANNNVRVSADGSVLGLWSSGTSPSGLQTYVKVGDSWTGHYQHDSAGYLVPSPDGKRIYTANGIYTNQLRLLGGTTDSGFSIPATHGPHYLTVTRHDGGEESTEKVLLKMEGDSRALAEVPKLKEVFRQEDRWSRQNLTLDKRLFLIPDANLVVQLAASEDKLVAVRFDIEKVMQQSDVDYLLLSSRPPLAVRAGDRVEYQIKVKSKAGGVTYSLDAGPEGMQLSPKGLLTWSTTKKSPADNNVIISVRDRSGQQVFHTFDLTVNGGDVDAPSVAVAGPAESGDPEQIPTKPADLEEASREVKLPGTIDDVVVGGEGRFLLFHLRDLKKIAVLDVSEATITGYLPASDDDTKVVAGATRALVFNVTQGVVTRYRLDTLERELSVQIPFPDPIQYAAMGSGSEGPVMLRTSKGTGALDASNFHFMGMHTMRRLEAQWPKKRPLHSVYRDRNDIRASTNGKVFVVQGIGVLRLSGTTVERLGDQTSGNALPAADGSHFLLNGRQLNADLRQINDSSTSFGTAVPSVTGQYFLSLNRAPRSPHRSAPDDRTVKLYQFGDSRPLVSVQDLAIPPAPAPGSVDVLGLAERLFFVPDAQVIVTVAASNDRAVLHQFSVDQALEASGTDYLLVDSHPPAHAELGERYVYAVNVKSKRGGVQYRLDAAPTGMKVSADGVVAWDVPKDMKKDEHSVVMAIEDDSGQSIFHTFSIQIPSATREAAAAQEQREQENHVAQIEAQRNRMDQRRARRQQPSAAQGKTADSPEQSAASSPFRPVARTWTDSSGEHRVIAAFVKVVDKKTVILRLDNGEHRKVPLSQLSNEDIYEAVKSDLLRRGTKLNRAPESPFQRP